MCRQWYAERVRTNRPGVWGPLLYSTHHKSHGHLTEKRRNLLQATIYSRFHLFTGLNETERKNKARHGRTDTAKPTVSTGLNRALSFPRSAALALITLFKSSMSLLPPGRKLLLFTGLVSIIQRPLLMVTTERQHILIWCSSYGQCLDFIEMYIGSSMIWSFKLLKAPYEWTPNEAHQ